MKVEALEIKLIKAYYYELELDVEMNYKQMKNMLLALKEEMGDEDFTKEVNSILGNE